MLGSFLHAPTRATPRLHTSDSLIHARRTVIASETQRISEPLTFAPLQAVQHRALTHRKTLHILHLDNYPFAFLREHFLSWEEWHHTSKQYNQTDFYLPRIPEWVETTEDVDALYQRWQNQQRTNTAKKTTTPVKARISYTHWVDKRTRKTVTEYAIICGPWAHAQSGLRKRTDGNHFHVDHTYTRAPFGTASIFHDIERAMKR